MYAERRYRRGLKRWRAKIFLICALISGPLIVGGIAVFVVDHHALSWAAGALSGAGIALWVSLRDSPPAYIEHWREGMEGERKTESVLRPLERESWTVVHDVDNRFGNYDHIAVSRAGVFLLDSKNLSGRVEVRGGVPHVRRSLDPDDERAWSSIPRRALGSAASLKEEIERRTGLRIWVQAVVVLWSDFPAELDESGRCAFVHGSRLRDWLRSRGQRLAQPEVEQIADALAALSEACDVADPVRRAPAIA